jgi:hypothetical protein
MLSSRQKRIVRVLHQSKVAIQLNDLGRMAELDEKQMTQVSVSLQELGLFRMYTEGYKLSERGIALAEEIRSEGRDRWLTRGSIFILVLWSIANTALSVFNPAIDRRLQRLEQEASPTHVIEPKETNAPAERSS